MAHRSDGRLARFESLRCYALGEILSFLPLYANCGMTLLSLTFRRYGKRSFELG